MSCSNVRSVLGLVAFAAMTSSGAMGQVATRFVVPDGAATSTKVTPGSSFAMDVRVDAPAIATVGASLRVIQSLPASPNGVFRIAARDFTASIYNDTTSGSPDAVVLQLPSALLNPDNDNNLGRNTIGFVGAATGTNLFAERITFAVDPATPLGIYTIKPTPGGTSAITDTGFNDYDMALNASFDVIVGRRLTISKSGAGTVTSDIGAINCGSRCSDIYPGSTVTLTATPATGSTFLGWTGGPCSGSGTCVVTVSAAATINAAFGVTDPGLNVSIAGAGTGSVSSVPAGINCPDTCSINPAPATVFTLTAAAAVGSTFVGWSGSGCSGTAACVLTTSGSNAVAAAFDLIPPALVSVSSRKVHGAAGTFDLPLTLLPLSNPTTEPRQSSTATIVMTFDRVIVSANAAITEGTAIAAVPTISGNNVTVGLTGVTNQQYVTISLTNVDSIVSTGGSGSVRMGFLAGDVNQDRVVTVSDLGLVNAQLAQPATAANFLKDVNASGALSVADKGITNANLAKALPPP